MKKRIDNINSHSTGASTFAIRTSQAQTNPEGFREQKSFHLSHPDKIETVYGSRTPLKNYYEVSN